MFLGIALKRLISLVFLVCNIFICVIEYAPSEVFIERFRPAVSVHIGPQLSRSSRIVFVQMCILLYYWANKMMMIMIVCIWPRQCHYHLKTLSSIASLKSKIVSPFWYRFAQVVLEKRPLNKCFCKLWLYATVHGKTLQMQGVALFLVTYWEKYYGIIIDIYGLTLEEVSTECSMHCRLISHSTGTVQHWYCNLWFQSTQFLVVHHLTLLAGWHEGQSVTICTDYPPPKFCFWKLASAWSRPNIEKRKPFILHLKTSLCWVSAFAMTLPAFVARAPAAINWYLLHALTLSSKPAAHRCCCRLTGQTDGRTPDRYIDHAHKLCRQCE